jgi:hypothetical protein
MTARLPTGYECLPAARARHLDEVCTRFEQSWRDGGRPQIETCLGEVSGLERTVLVRELLLVEIPYRWRAGDSVAVEDYRERFPELERDWLDLALVAPTAPMSAPGAEWDELPTVAGYEILRELGRGGMGVVYQARDNRLGRLVALKFLSPGAARDPRRLERFQREARAASSLNHPAVCTLHHVGECQGRPFLVLEFVEGQTLRTLVGTHTEFTRLLPLFQQVAEALRVAHAAGIIHRDIKPDNLMVRPDGYIKVLDFGLARLRPPGAASVWLADSDPGTPVGTPGYMSPEQARGESVGGATDIFSLGVVLYELVTGRHPFTTTARWNLPTASALAAVVPPARWNPEVRAPLEALILRMLAENPDERPTAAEVEAELAALANPPGGGACQGPGGTARQRRLMVGRDPERAALRAAFDSAAAGSGRVLCVTGEPGIGKSTLVEDFLAELSACGRTHISARGRCSEHLAGTEAYLPVLEALDSLVRGGAGAAATRALRQCAPSWYRLVAPSAQFVSRGAPDAPERLNEGPTAVGASQERLKRELLALVEEVAREWPLVLFLDDVHWADASTIDLLTHLGSRCAGLSLLVLVTYRPTEMLLGPHPFVSAQQELQRHGVCRAVPLTLLERPEVESYLEQTFPRQQFPAGFIELVCEKTGGNPLFLVDLLRSLRDRGVIAEQAGGWALVRAVPNLHRELPESVRSLIQRKITQPGEADRRLLSAASVQGHEFDSAVVARLLGLSAAAVEERLEVLDRVHGLVRLQREQEFPNGTRSLRYRFTHVLYQSALNAALSPTRRRSWSAAAAAALVNLHQGPSAGGRVCVRSDRLQPVSSQRDDSSSL